MPLTRRGLRSQRYLMRADSIIGPSKRSSRHGNPFLKRSLRLRSKTMPGRLRALSALWARFGTKERPQDLIILRRILKTEPILIDPLFFRRGFIGPLSGKNCVYSSLGASCTTPWQQSTYTRVPDFSRRVDRPAPMMTGLPSLRPSTAALLCAPDSSLITAAARRT